MEIQKIVMAERLADFPIAKSRITAYHPRTERFIPVLLTALP